MSIVRTIHRYIVIQLGPVILSNTLTKKILSNLRIYTSQNVLLSQQKF